MKEHTLTDAEIAGGGKRTPGGSASKYPPRWIRLAPKGHCPETGFTRAAMYGLIAAGKVKTAVLRRPGTVRGQRFVFLPSVLELLDREAAKESARVKSTARGAAKGKTADPAHPEKPISSGPDAA